MERSGGTEEEEEAAGMHMRFALLTQRPLRTSSSSSSSLSQLCGTDGGGKSGTRLRGGCSDRFDHELGFYIQGDIFKPPIYFKTKVPFWPGLARSGQAKTELNVNGRFETT